MRGLALALLQSNPDEIPDEAIPRRYVVVGWVRGAKEMVHYWSRRDDAERAAGYCLDGGYSTKLGGQFTRVQVLDRINKSRVIWDRRRDTKNYGV